MCMYVFTFFGRWWWLALSVPAGWREQGLQPSHHHPKINVAMNSLPLPPATSYQNQEYRNTSRDYCDLYDKISEGPTLYSCKICGKTVSNRWHHAAIHRPQTNLCPLCQQTFTRRDNMKAHIRLKHGALVTDVLGDPKVERDVSFMWSFCDVDDNLRDWYDIKQWFMRIDLFNYYVNQTENNHKHTISYSILVYCCLLLILLLWRQ